MSAEASHSAVSGNKEPVEEDIREYSQTQSVSRTVHDLEPIEFDVDNVERVYK